MANKSNVRLTFNFNDPNLEPGEQDEQVQWFITELKEMDEIENVARVYDPNPPEGNKALGGFLLGMLTAEFNIENTKKLFSFLGDRLGGKSIQLEVEANGKKLKVSAHSREELELAIKAAQEFIADK
ncbi:hypothetical protein VF14_05285 [Nostoc linckia z18]|uniref:Uncharacterized protein n=2 Tax=Nostoc linckia TaxID=92942 RepID=A0A9Q6EMM5_NOSLI|nr:hypothetical protein [Nostoc linckia]PHK41951.1 hypothetical protein VF12_04920 [Nostoc linckia z15]PHK46682.1 hypothetical protein VF13_09630 [Nostoc linckia z16]PHJ67523.1 hypothetical protein VF02_04875 [Nostoc linckia z1]PHJ72548.1 hypothetical protein VF05_03835 [Nostoc linckia z3]PHJ74890.1 hypothetical protein VF03_12650 [Nostoc linckia z2]